MNPVLVNICFWIAPESLTVFLILKDHCLSLIFTFFGAGEVLLSFAFKLIKVLVTNTDCSKIDWQFKAV